MKKTILLIIVLSSAILLLQCSQMKEVLKDLNDLSTKDNKESEKVSSSSWKPQFSSSSSEVQISSSSLESLKKRKEVN